MANASQHSTQEKIKEQTMAKPKKYRIENKNYYAWKYKNRQK